MSRSGCSLLLLFLLCFLALASSAYKVVDEEEVGMSLVVQKHKHKHSGFSQAECPGACDFRCSKTQYKKPCLFFCQKCCFKCKCVPPGTYAHKESHSCTMLAWYKPRYILQFSKALTWFPSHE
ncbi:hypothetical protein J5N97_003680 [Dioscorea zingiberensis]|uniref:Uncharacterized protein n=1 Tax=Dioscorea zingiberensis TaxID=325984 RepID=A0A9D5HQM8_9LILI|nr:hypothetical protein J5N97_003680 [Dioscorea zingiberensis]